MRNSRRRGLPITALDVRIVHEAEAVREEFAHDHRTLVRSVEEAAGDDPAPTGLVVRARRDDLHTLGFLPEKGETIVIYERDQARDVR